jgi:hypothetical protein
MLGAPASLRVGDRAARRALRTYVPHRDQPLMCGIRTDLPARAIDPLLDLLRERIHPRPRPSRDSQTATGFVAGTHRVRNGFVITAHELHRPRSEPVKSNASRISITSSAERARRALRDAGCRGEEHRQCSRCARVRARMRLDDDPDAAGSLVAARYLSPRAREALAEAGMSYVDGTGNVRVAVAEPAGFVLKTFSSRSPVGRARKPRGCPSQGGKGQTLGVSQERVRRDELGSCSSHAITSLPPHWRSQHSLPPQL